MLFLLCESHGGDPGQFCQDIGQRKERDQGLDGGSQQLAEEKRLCSLEKLGWTSPFSELVSFVNKESPLLRSFLVLVGRQTAGAGVLQLSLDHVTDVSGV